MAVKSSGANANLRLRGTASDGETDINEEINGESTNANANVSLTTLSTGAGFDTLDGGHKMSEFFGYSAGASDARTSGSPSAATAKWLASFGSSSGKIHVSTNNNPAAHSWSTVQVAASNIYFNDACWDGFTWVLVGKDGIWQTSNSAGTSGWTKVVGTREYTAICPVMGGWIAAGRNLQIAYSSNITGTVSSSNWTETGVSGFSSGSDYFLNALSAGDKFNLGVRKDYGGDPCWGYLDIPDLSQGIDTSATTFQTSPSPPWGYFQAWDPNNGNWMFGQRSGGLYRGTIGSSTKTGDQPPFATSYNVQPSFAGGKWYAMEYGKAKIAYKTSYTGSWTEVNVSQNVQTKTMYNGSYYGFGMNPGSSSSNIIGGSTNGTSSWSYIPGSTLGTSETYCRVVVPSLRTEYGSFTNLGNSSTATYHP